MRCVRGFTLVEILVALLMLSLLALMSYRGLGAVLDAREHIRQDSAKWERIALFFVRFQRDVELAAPRPVRFGASVAPAWVGGRNETAQARLEFSRFASNEDIDTAHRIGYLLNDKGEIELLLWPGLDVDPDTVPKHYPVLVGVKIFELQYMNAALAWVDAWPSAPNDLPIPRAVRLRIVLSSDEEIVRVFVLQS